MSFIDIDRLRASLLREPAHGEPVREQGSGDQVLSPAAVLFPIVERDDGHTVLFTQRTAHLRDHAGQVSFPGGRVEADDPSPVHTALRETEEEIGLGREHVEVPRARRWPRSKSATGSLRAPKKWAAALLPIR